MAQDPFWDFFSKIYVISVTTSTRKEALRINFAKARLTRYEILDFAPAEKAVNDACGNRKDVSLSELLDSDRCDETCQNIRSNHLAAIQKAADADAPNVLIFEDDAEFEVPIDWQRLKQVGGWLREHPLSWDIFYLGYVAFPKPFMRPVGLHVVEIVSPYLAHAYALNRRAIQYISAHQTHLPKIHIDAGLARLPVRKVGIFPNLCFQSVDPAIYTKALEKLHLRIRMKDFIKFYEVLCILLFPLVILTCAMICLILCR